LYEICLYTNCFRLIQEIYQSGARGISFPEITARGLSFTSIRACSFPIIFPATFTASERTGPRAIAEWASLAMK